jgi:hypothetical protein
MKGFHPGIHIADNPLEGAVLRIMAAVVRVN